jgi:histidyl-tRNA synthetase
VRAALGDLGLGAPVCDALFAALALKSLDGLANLLGDESAAVRELTTLFALAESYGYADWLELDLSVVRGLAYYTGVVFEGFDRKGELRAIFGGGRYDQLLTSFGAEPMAAVGFGFGDAVIVELLKDKALLPALDGAAAAPAVDAVVFALDPAAQPSAIAAASALRAAGRRVDLVLEGKKFKWVIKHAERLGAPALVVCGTKEAARGAVGVKTLATGEQVEVPLAELAGAVPRVAGGAA